MSKATGATDLPENGVRNRSQYADTLHRRNPDADEARLACPEADYRPDAEFAVVPLAADCPHYELRGKPG